MNVARDSSDNGNRGTGENLDDFAGELASTRGRRMDVAPADVPPVDVTAVETELDPADDGTAVGTEATTDNGGDDAVVTFPDAPPRGRVLTMRQHKILQVIRDSVERRGYPPSVREIGQAAGLRSPSSVAHQLKVLERRGLLRRDPEPAPRRRHPPAGGHAR